MTCRNAIHTGQLYFGTEDGRYIAVGRDEKVTFGYVPADRSFDFHIIPILRDQLPRFLSRLRDDESPRERLYSYLALDQEDGEQRRGAWGLSWLHQIIYRLAWPMWEGCDLCVGQDPWQGCWCEYVGATSPGEGPELRHLLARWLWKRVRKDRA
jgi:hypothetical protein